ncbi:MAG: hypothetical protein WCF04_02545 [Candidatus Nanopelagicales bacterium]
MPRLASGPFTSPDGAARYVLAGAGVTFEAVHYSWADPARDAVCISAQAGCGYGCQHCATTFSPMPFQRSLTAGEMVSSVRLVLADRGLDRVGTVDVSGIGDPSRNWEAVATAGQLLLDAGHTDRVTVTTVAPQRWVRARLVGGWLPAKVRISLHGATRDARRLIVTNGDDPGRVVGLWEQLAQSVPVELNYVLHEGNTHPRDVAGLACLLEGRQFAALRLCPLNPVPGSPVRPCPDPAGFAAAVRATLPGWVVEEFTPLGSQVSAACGQLRVRALG